MANFNKVILLGNITRDLELRFSSTGMAVCSFGLAVNTKRGGDKDNEVYFAEIVAFDKKAEAIEKYCKRGDPLLIEGRLKMNEWNDKDGQKRSKTQIIVNNFQFLKGKNESSSGNSFEAPARNSEDIPL